MSKVREGADGGHQQASSAPTAAEAPWLEDLTLLSPEGELWGWTSRWRHQRAPGLNIVVIPRLCLSPTPVYRFVHVRGYADVFKGCCLQGPGLDSEPFAVLGAVFPLYRTGRTELRQVVATLGGTTWDLSKIVQLGTDLLT